MVPRPTNAPRAFAPTATRSAQGIAATGRYVESPGAIKIYGDPYTYDDSSPLQVEPVQQQRQTTPRDPAADDNMVETPVGKKQGTVDPRIDQAIKDTFIDVAKGIGKNAAVPLAVGTLTGQSFSKLLPLAIGNALAGAPQTALSTLGYRAVNEGLPLAYAELADMMDPNSYTYGLDEYRDEQGRLNLDQVPAEKRMASALGLADKYERSQSFTSRLGDLASGAAKTVGGWFGFDDEPGMTPEAQRARAELNAAVDDLMKDQVAPADVEGIDETALGEQTPDFALSDYDHQLMASEEKQLAEMAAREKEQRQKDSAKAQAEADALARDLEMGRPSGWNNRGFTMGGFSSHSAGFGRPGSTRDNPSGYGGYGGLNPGESAGTNPGGFSKASGGNAGGGFGGGGMSNGRGRN